MIPIYREIENSLLDILITIKDRLEVLDVKTDIIEQTEEAISFVNSKRYQVAVVGAFKTGKSSLINALLGAPKLLPEDIIPATATINRIVFGKNKNATAYFYDGNNEEISINELAKYVAKTTSDGAFQASLIKEVVLSIPTVLCQNHVEVIDTPGLNDDEKMTSITLQGIENVDAVILTISQQFQFDEYICNFVCDLIKKDSITNIIFVVTHIDDLYDTLEDEGISYEEYIELLKNQIRNKVVKKLDKNPECIKKAHNLLDDDKIQLFGVSSRFYFEYLLTKDLSKLEKSKFQIFNDNLITIITSQQIENTIIKTRDNISNIIEACSSIKEEKEKEYDAELVKIQDINTFMNNYSFPDCICKIFNETYYSHYNEYEELQYLLNKEKNVIAKKLFYFIEEIKSKNDNEKLRQLLISKFIEIEKEEEENCSLLRRQILEQNEKVFQDFREKIQQEFSEQIDILDELVDYSLLETFLMKEDSIKELVTFQWESCPITQYTDCIHIDLMDLFIDVIDSTIEKIKLSVKDVYETLIPQNIINILSVQKNDIDARLNYEKNAIQEEWITFKNNYLEFSSKIPELKTQLEEIFKKYKENA